MTKPKFVNDPQHLKRWPTTYPTLSCSPPQRRHRVPTRRLLITSHPLPDPTIHSSLPPSPHYVPPLKRRQLRFCVVMQCSRNRRNIVRVSCMTRKLRLDQAGRNTTLKESAPAKAPKHPCTGKWYRIVQCWSVYTNDGARNNPPKETVATRCSEMPR